MSDRRSRFLATIGSWRFLVAAILVALSCAYLVPIERSIGLFSQANAHANTLSSGSLEAPAALLANATGPGTIKLDWAASVSPFATGYTIHRLNPGDTDYTLVATVLGHGTVTYTDGGLAPASMYVYRIESISGDWNSTPSPIAFATTP